MCAHAPHHKPLAVVLTTPPAPPKRMGAQKEKRAAQLGFEPTPRFLTPHIAPHRYIGAFFTTALTWAHSKGRAENHIHTHMCLLKRIARLFAFFSQEIGPCKLSGAGGREASRCADCCRAGPHAQLPESTKKRTVPTRPERIHSTLKLCQNRLTLPQPLIMF